MIALDVSSIVTRGRTTGDRLLLSGVCRSPTTQLVSSAKWR
jgi:hypothetical protein